jgi:hypothetical protein
MRGFSPSRNQPGVFVQSWLLLHDLDGEINIQKEIRTLSRFEKTNSAEEEIQTKRMCVRERRKERRLLHM